VLPGSRPDITVIGQVEIRKLAFRVVASGGLWDAFVKAYIVVVHECSSERRLAKTLHWREGKSDIRGHCDEYDGDDLSPEVRHHYDASYAIVQNDSIQNPGHAGP